MRFRLRGWTFRNSQIQERGMHHFARALYRFEEISSPGVQPGPGICEPGWPVGCNPLGRTPPVKSLGVFAMLFINRINLIGWLLLFTATCGLAQSPQPVVNGGFEDGLKAWQSTGDVHLERKKPQDGKVSAIIGPGPGSLTQRIET